MEVKSFKGGVHVPHSKGLTEAKETVVCSPPASVFISMRQHIGAPAKPVVAPKDSVKKGQLIGEAGGFVSANIHSSVSGTVKKIHTMKIMGLDTTVIQIDNDFEETWHESVKPRSGIDQLSGSDIKNLIMEAGIVGMGGAGFPLHVKLSPPENKPIDTFIVNGTECEPYLTCDHRLMLEESDQIIQGLLFMMKTVSVKKAYIGIEVNKPDAIEVMKNAAAPYDSIEVVPLAAKYPQGGEKQLIYACTKREVPSGGLPADIGVVVANVATTKAVADYVVMGQPVTERVCTVTGSGITTPKNLLIKVGTPLQHLIDECDGLTADSAKLIMGGPMMGNAVASTSFPSTKTTGGLLILNLADSKIGETTACIKCGRCVTACPMGLQPVYISQYSLRDRMDLAEKYHPVDCIECGSCSFICPANRPLVHSIRVAKRHVMENRRKV